MTLADVANKARALTHTDTTNYTTANILIDINIWYQKVADMIFESQDDGSFDDQRIGAGGSAGTVATYPIVTVPLVAAQRDYAIPVATRMLKIRRVDVSYDGTNFFRAMPFDTGVLTTGFGNSTNEDANMIKTAPRYTYQYNSIFLYPMAASTDAIGTGAVIRVMWDRNVIPFTSADYTTDPNDSTQVPGFDAPFHPILAYGSAYEYSNANNLPQLQNIKQDLMDWEMRLRTAYGRKQKDEILALRPAYDSYGDYGATGSGGYFYGR